MGTLEILGVVVSSNQMELELAAETDHSRSLFYNMGNVVPRFCTCISDRFQALLQSVLTFFKNVTFTCLPGIMLMNLCKQIKNS